MTHPSQVDTKADEERTERDFPAVLRSRAAARLQGAGRRPGGRGPRVTERVIDEFFSYVEANGLKPGDRLPPERVFIDQWNVSRSSLREAVRVLATIGVVDVRHGDGMYVAAGSGVAGATPNAIFDATEEFALRNLVETRIGIEISAVTAAIERASDEDLLGLERFLDDQENELAENPDFSWEPLSFEIAIIELTGNSWLYDVELMLRDAWRGLSSGLRTSVGRHHEWQTEHRAILASMRTRNTTQAQRLVIAHLSVERFQEDIDRPKKRPKN